MNKILYGVALVVSLLSLSGCQSLFGIADNQELSNDADTRTETQNQIYQALPEKSFKEIYVNNQQGYRLQYPSYFTVDETKNDEVIFGNTTCEDNDGFCFLGIDSFHIIVMDNSDYESLDAYYTNRADDCSTIQQMKIAPLPEQFQTDQLYDAVRCTFDPVPKQAKGGYSYALFHNEKLFIVQFIHGDGYVSAYDTEGNHDSIAVDTYDPVGDMIMKTFRFTQ